MKNWLTSCGLTMSKAGSSFVVRGTRKNFDEWMFIEFEMECAHSFKIGGLKYLVYSYHNTDDIILIKECTNVVFSFVSPGSETISVLESLV